MLTRVDKPINFRLHPIDENTERIELRFPTHSDFDDLSLSAEDQKTIRRVLAYSNTHKSISVTDVIVGPRSAYCTVHRPIGQKLRARLEIINRLNFSESRRTR